jgi:hypothetical protein
LREEKSTDFHGLEGFWYRKSALHLCRSIKNSSTKESDENLIRYRAQFVAGGLVALVEEWLKNGMNIPAPELVKLLAKLARAVIVQRLFHPLSINPLIFASVCGVPSDVGARKQTSLCTAPAYSIILQFYYLYSHKFH